jgi:signal transduction histidine kinase
VCPKSLETEPFADSNGLTSNLTRAVLTDRFGDIWVGTEMGIDRFRPRRFEPFSEQEFKYYPAIAIASDGSVWIQKQGKALQHFANEHLTEVGPKRGISPLAPDSSGGVWLLDPWAHRLEHYDRDNRKILSVPPPLKDTAAQGLVATPSNSILVAFEGNGLWSFGNQWNKVDDQRLPGDTPTALIRNGDAVWIGYFDNRLAVWNGQAIRVYRASDGLDVGTPLTVASAGSVAWVAGTDGIDFLKNGRFYRLLVRKPERLRGISGIAFDNEGNLWLNTGFGAMRIRSAEIAKILDDPGHEAVTSVFGSADGVIGIPAQTKPVPSLLKDGAGRLWFATAGNLVTLWPTSVDAAHPNANLDLQEIQVNGRKIPLAGLETHPLVLDGTLKNRVEIDYGAVDLDHPNHIVYRYLLEGEDKGWQMVGSGRQAIYTKLRPGTYRFRFAATNGEDRWKEVASPLVIRVNPAFYQTTWFFVVCCALVLMVAWLLYQARVRYVSEQLRDRLEHRSNERLRIARELHDTLLQSIHGLMLRFHFVVESLAADDPVRPALEIALKRADDFILEGRNKVQDLRGESDKDKTLSEMLAQVVREFSHESAASVRITEEGFTIPLRPLVQEELCTIGRECIVNALHHSKGERIEIDLLYKRRYFRLRCRDNGQGIPEEIIQSGGRNGHWGLQGMKERANSIGAKISIWTEDGKGTEIDVRLNGKAAYANQSLLSHLKHRVLKH